MFTGHNLLVIRVAELGENNKIKECRLINLSENKAKIKQTNKTKQKS